MCFIGLICDKQPFFFFRTSLPLPEVLIARGEEEEGLCEIILTQNLLRQRLHSIWLREITATYTNYEEMQLLNLLYKERERRGDSTIELSYITLAYHFNPRTLLSLPYLGEIKEYIEKISI